jgi:SAM-dependent methyltransferase
LGGQRYCPVCERRVGRFTALGDSYTREWKAHGFDHGVADFEMLNAADYGCPHCGASDRDRICALYLRRRLANVQSPLRLIDFAPSPALSSMLRHLPQIRYRSADLYMDGVDDRIDIVDMRAYADASVDCFICLHVLEHVSDDAAAMRELARILVPGGWGILLVPVSTRLERTRENPSAATEAERWRWFGQNDHVRLHTRRDFVMRAETAGLHVSKLGVDEFSRAEFGRCGITESSILYVVETHR